MGVLPAEEHPVVANPQGVHISLVTVLQVMQHLRSHVERRAKHGLSQVLIAKYLRKPEIRNLCNSIMPEYVG